MDHHRTALAIALTALVLGLLGDTLLRYIPWGLNALLWTLAFVIGALRNRRSALAAVFALIAAGGLMWRDSPVLVGLDIALLAIFLPMLALEARGVRVAAAGISEIGAAMAVTAGQSVIGLPQLIAFDLSWSRIPRGNLRGAGILLRGAVIATPALLLFGALLVSADPTFEKVLLDLAVFDVEELLLHLVVTILIAAVCAGFLRSLFLSGPMPRVPRPGFLSLGIAETNVALGLLNVLFALFVAVQFHHFFAGPPGALSDFARRGFFELVWVVALVVPMLLVVEWLIDKKDAKGLFIFRLLSATQVALIFVIAASAYRRMQLYRDEFGLTRLRFFTTAFMIWVAVVLLWFVLTVLTGRRHRFALGALTTAVACVVVLHVMNPDSLIVQTNLSRATRRPFDAAYAARLSDDAGPVILTNADAFGAELHTFTKRPRTMGWRTWNLSRARAMASIRDYESKATPPMARP